MVFLLVEIYVRFIILRFYWRDLNILLIVVMVEDLNKWNKNMFDEWLMDVCYDMEMRF